MCLGLGVAFARATSARGFIWGALFRRGGAGSVSWVGAGPPHRSRRGRQRDPGPSRAERRASLPRGRGRGGRAPLRARAGAGPARVRVARATPRVRAPARSQTANNPKPRSMALRASAARPAAPAAARRPRALLGRASLAPAHPIATSAARGPHGGTRGRAASVAARAANHNKVLSVEVKDGAGGDDSDAIQGVERPVILGVTLPEDRQTQFLIMAAGALTCSLGFAALQESVFRIPGFTYPGFMTLVTSACYAACGFIEMGISTKGKFTRNGTWKNYWILSTMTFGGMFLTNFALKFLNYATRIVFKSAKVIPVMLFATIVNKKTYSPLEYFSAFTLVTGVALFTLGDAAGGSVNFNPIGVVLITLALCVDALTSNFEEKVFFRVGKPSSQAEVLGYASLLGCFWSLIQNISQGELGPALAHASEHSRVIPSICAFSVLGYVSVGFVLSLITYFGATGTHERAAASARTACSMRRPCFGCVRRVAPAGSGYCSDTRSRSGAHCRGGDRQDPAQGAFDHHLLRALSEAAELAVRRRLRRGMRVHLSHNQGEEDQARAEGPRRRRVIFQLVRRLFNPAIAGRAADTATLPRAWSHHGALMHLHYIRLRYRYQRTLRVEKSLPKMGSSRSL